LHISNKSSTFAPNFKLLLYNNHKIIKVCLFDFSRQTDAFLRDFYPPNLSLCSKRNKKNKKSAKKFGGMKKKLYLCSR